MDKQARIIPSLRIVLALPFPSCPLCGPKIPQLLPDSQRYTGGAQADLEPQLLSQTSMFPLPVRQGKTGTVGHPFFGLCSISLEQHASDTQAAPAERQDGVQVLSPEEVQQSHGCGSQGLPQSLGPQRGRATILFRLPKRNRPAKYSGVCSYIPMSI